MSFSIGIIGLPNVGKSTLFKALTKKQVDTSNYPFCTIEPNVGCVAVPDERLDKLAEVLKPDKVIATTIEFVDIAGLVKNAHQGEGLGNQFLSHIRKVDAICQVVRGFEDANVSHVSGKLNPVEDIKTINLELVMADLSTVNKRLEEVKPRARSGEKEAQEWLPLLEKLQQCLDKSKLVAELELGSEEKDLIKELNLLTIKPMLHALNAAEGDLKDEMNIPEPNVIISAKIESELAELSPKEAVEYVKELGLPSSGLDQLIKTSYELLDLITFFTTQNNILQAWTIKKGAKAPEAAGLIHTDFTEGFIKAEVINWAELTKTGSIGSAREKGLLRIEGKDYEVQDGEVVCFAFKV